jgi:catechol 2,3-dioxygenase-like lactoylglutathione lyase family enzyme
MPSFGPVVPVLRIFDEAKAREFYADFLGFQIDFEHRFGADFPLYLGVSRGDCVLHLTEHHGDASPGAHIRNMVADLAAYAGTLTAQNYRYAKPGAPQPTSWGTVELTVGDPFGNRLTFVASESAVAANPAADV